MNDKSNLRKKIIGLTKEYFELYHGLEDFIPGKSYINYSGRVFDYEEGEYLVNAALDFWLSAGDYAMALENSLSNYFGIK